MNQSPLTSGDMQRSYMPISPAVGDRHNSSVMSFNSPHGPVHRQQSLPHAPLERIHPSGSIGFSQGDSSRSQTAHCYKSLTSVCPSPLLSLEPDASGYRGEIYQIPLHTNTDVYYRDAQPGPRLFGLSEEENRNQNIYEGCCTPFNAMLCVVAGIVMSF